MTNDSRVERKKIGVRLLAAGAMLVLLGSWAGAQQPSALQQRLAAVKQAAASNQQALQKYSWTENMQVSLSGDVKSTKQMTCQYGPDGKPQCVPIGPPPEQSQKRGLRGRIAENKKDDLTDYMQQVKGVIGLYVPPNGARLDQAVQAGNASVTLPAGGEAALVLKSYAQQGDSMSLDFAMATKRLKGLSVNTYVGDPSSPVTMSVLFAQLPDGTSYPSQIVVNAPAKKIQVTVSNSNYQRISM